MSNYIKCCDCVDGLMSLNSESVPCAVTSPPWDDLYEFGGHEWDFERTAEHLYRVMVPGGVVVWDIMDRLSNGGVSLTSHRQALFFVEVGFTCHEIIVIDKPHRRAPQVNRYALTHQMVYVFTKGHIRCFNGICDRPNKEESVGKRFWFNRRRPDGSTWYQLGTPIKEFGKRRGIWQVSQHCPNDYTVEHPARMQEHLARDLIVSYSKPGDVVLDPFMGTATTCKMALLNHRKFIGFEIHRPYYDIAQRRMQEAWMEYLR
jgi:DNA modification methylase